MKNIFKILIISLTTYTLNAMNCSNYKDFQLYNGHYYSTSIDKLDFESAKQIAINNGGTLAIPNNAAENEFIKKLIGGGSIGWIGIYDPNKIQNFCYGGNCAYDDARFKTVKNESLSYKNFHQQQPDNLIKEYDVVDGKAMVSPLGEHWVAMNGTNGQWLDVGNHADEYNNPVKYRAVFEFENLSECTPPTDDGEQELTGRFCNSKVWDETVDVVTMGNTFDCQIDSFGNEYCPEALAKAGEYWDYDDGFSVAGVGSVVDYAEKIEGTEYVDKITETESVPKEAVQVVIGTRDGSSAQWNSTSTSHKRAYVMWKNGGECWNGWKQSNFSKYNSSSYSDQDNYYHQVSTSRCEYYLGPYYKYGIKYTCPAYAQDWDSDAGEGAGNCWRVIVVCPSGYTDNGSNCKKTIKVCPSGYTNTTGSETSKGECKKTVSYTYYEYLCKNEPNTQGENYFPTTSTTHEQKIDTNKNSINGSTLDDMQGSSTPPSNNCKRKGFTCNSNIRTPAFVNNEWQCSPFPCLGESNFNKLDTEVGSSDKNNDGWQEDGSCDGELYLFNGKSAKCRSWDMFFGLTGGGCCDKDKVAAGLVACKADEKMLAKKREAKKTHYIGNFCSKKLRLGFAKICVQKSDGYCTFNSSLGKIIQVQGRSQLGISWGSPDNPECRGFTPDEFQKIDFSKIDLTEFVKDIQSSVQTSVVENLGTYVKDKVQGFYEEN